MQEVLETYLVIWIIGKSSVPGDEDYSEGPIDPVPTSRKALSVDKLTLLVAILALALSVWTFWIVQVDRQRAQVEGQPRLSSSYSPYGVKERYGFSIRNTGEQRARIPFIVYTFNNIPTDAMRASDLLAQLQLSSSGVYRLISAPTYVLEPQTTTELYTFSEVLDEARQDLWERYSSLLAADVCFCDIDFRQCWTKRVSRSSRQAVGEHFVCNAGELRREILTD